MFIPSRFKEDMLCHPIFDSDVPIDILYLDSTYCSPRSQFPNRVGLHNPSLKDSFGMQEEAYMEIVQIIRANKGYHFVLGIDSVGKEELLIALANEFETKVKPKPKRLENFFFF